MTQFQEYLFGIPISTHRGGVVGTTTNSFGSFLLLSSGLHDNDNNNNNEYYEPFPYEYLIAAISIFFFRTAIYQHSGVDSHPLLRYLFGLLLGVLAFIRKPYELIFSVELFSYAVPYLLFTPLQELPFARILFGIDDKTSSSTTSSSSTKMKFIRLLLVGISALLSLGLCHGIASGVLFSWGKLVIPNFIIEFISSGFPVDEIMAAYHVLDKFVYTPGLLKTQVLTLFFVTFHIQCGIGYLGIDFLKKEQERRNQLVRMDVVDEDTTTATENGGIEGKSSTSSSSSSKSTKDVKKKPDIQKKTDDDKSIMGKGIQSKKMANSKAFQRSAGPFILLTAVPYMAQIIFYGNLNRFAFCCFKDDIHRSIRNYDLFDNDSNLVALSEHSAKSPEAFAGYMDVIVDTTYDLFNRKLFSLPKVLLLPMVMTKQPKMMIQIFPIIFVTDWLKGRAIAYMTNRIEQLEKQTQDIIATRSKVEAFDMKNAELLQRAGPGAMEFTKRRWEELTVQVQMKTVAKDLTQRTKMFFGWIERNFVFSVLVDCALAHLIAVGRIVAADIFVFSRAIEDAVDMVLMKSRSEAELARMMTQIENMEELASVWSKAETRNLLPCNLASTGTETTADHYHHHPAHVTLRNLLYTRGTAVVRVDHLDLKAGVYALTGANGSGKSTLFRVLMSCETNGRPIDLPPSIVLSTPNAPIIEEDDLEREVSCEDADEAAEIEIDAATGETRSLSSSGNGGDASNAAVPPPVEDAHPRLSITMPSPQVVEISQTFYWPLYSRPIDWIFQEHVTDTCGEAELDTRLRRVAEELHSLEFTQSLGSTTEQENNDTIVPDDDGDDNLSSVGPGESPTEDAIIGIMEQLLEEKEDWFNDLSGGQRSKVELVRKVFLQDECPHVLLIDETMAPLDPRSKSLVMSKIKSFCHNSVVIVIYHTDVGREQEGEEGQAVECVPSNDFFDGNIHVENQGIHIRPVC